jgi:hypothetical protein
MAIVDDFARASIVKVKKRFGSSVPVIVCLLPQQPKLIPEPRRSFKGLGLLHLS